MDTMQTVLVYAGAVYGILTGLHIIFAGLAAALPAAKVFGVLATWTGALAIDLQNITGLGSRNDGAGMGMKRGSTTFGFLIGVALAGVLFLVGCAFLSQPKNITDLADLQACAIEHAVAKKSLLETVDDCGPDAAAVLRELLASKDPRVVGSPARHQAEKLRAALHRVEDETTIPGGGR